MAAKQKTRKRAELTDTENLAVGAFGGSHLWRLHCTIFLPYRNTSQSCQSVRIEQMALLLAFVVVATCTRRARDCMPDAARHGALQ